MPNNHVRSHMLTCYSIFTYPSLASYLFIFLYLLHFILFIYLYTTVYYYYV